MAFIGDSWFLCQRLTSSIADNLTRRDRLARASCDSKWIAKDLVGLRSIMASFVAFASSLIALITFIGVAIKALDQFVDDSDEEIVRQKIVNFWVSTERNIPMFLRLCWLMLLIMFVVICVENHNRNADELEKDFMTSITVDFSILANTYYIEAVPE
jgi:hypothetical protein